MSEINYIEDFPYLCDILDLRMHLIRLYQLLPFALETPVRDYL